MTKSRVDVRTNEITGMPNHIGIIFANFVCQILCDRACVSHVTFSFWPTVFFKGCPTPRSCSGPPTLIRKCYRNCQWFLQQSLFCFLQVLKFHEVWSTDGMSSSHSSTAYSPKMITTSYRSANCCVFIIRHAT